MLFEWKEMVVWASLWHFLIICLKVDINITDAVFVFCLSMVGNNFQAVCNVKNFAQFELCSMQLKVGNGLFTLSFVCVANEIEAKSFSFRLTDCVPRYPFGFEFIFKLELVLS